MMTRLCSCCSSLDFKNLFFNDFCQYAKFLDLVNELDDREGDIVTESELVGSQREDFLGDRTFDYEYEYRQLEDFLRKVNYEGNTGNDAVRAFLDDRLFTPLETNPFARSVGSLSDIILRSKHCDFCELVLDVRLWRVPTAEMECHSASVVSEGTDDILLSAAADKRFYLFPLWPTLKTMWYNSYITPNELCVLMVSSNQSRPPDYTDDCFFDRARDLRTLCVVDNLKGIWQQVPPTVDWQRVRSWIPRHDPNQSLSSKNDTRHAPTYMMIDIDKNQIVKIATHEQSTLQYAALSYVWGAARTSEAWCQNVQFVHDRRSAEPVSLSVSTLPATLQGAIDICKHLDIPYLWVDSLCIAQNQAEEKAATIADMGIIYAGCYLCIVAAADGNVHDALPGITSGRSQPLVRLGDLNVGMCLPPIREAVHRSNWNSRGWTFQESTLAARSLVILNDQVFLQDGRSIFCESVDVDIGNSYDNPQQDYKEEPLTTLDLYDASSDADMHSVFSIYKDMVENYSRRNLTFTDDIENAFRGLLGVLESKFEIHFLLSLPRRDKNDKHSRPFEFGRSLNWFCPNAKTLTGVQPTSRRFNARGSAFAPSWTWISRIGPVSYTSIPDDGTVNFIPGLLDPQTSRAQLSGTGFNSYFATTKAHKSSANVSTLDSPILLQAPVYHPDHIQWIGKNVTLTTYLRNLDQHRYVLDAGNDYKFLGEPYFLPIARFTTKAGVDEATAENSIATGLIIELFEYPYMKRSSWPESLQSDEIREFLIHDPHMGAPVKHKLTPFELKDKVYLARRVGIFPYGLCRFVAHLPEDYICASKEAKTCIVLG